MRAAADLDDGGVAGAQADFLDRQLEPIRDHLRKGGLVSLPRRLRAAYHDESVALDQELDPLARRADRRFDVVRDTDAARPHGLALALGEAGVVRHLERALHVAGEVSGVEDQAHRCAIGQLCLGHEVAPTNLGTIDPQLPRRHVEQALDDVMRFRSTGAAIGHGRNRIRGERLHAQRDRRYPVDRGQDGAEVGERHERHGMRADVAAHMHVVGDEAPVATAAERRANRRVATLEIGEEGFAARRTPTHRPPQALGGPDDDDLLGMQIVARAEAAADIQRDDPHLFGLHHLAEVVLEKHGALAAADERVAVVAVEPDRRARLHLAVDDARDVEFMPHDARGFSECSRHRGSVAELVIEARRLF